MPVILNPHLIEPETDALAVLDYAAAGGVLSTSGVVSHNKQDVAFLARAVDTRFIATARGEEQKRVLKTIVAMHRGLTGTTKGTDLLSVGGFDPANGGLAFLIGAVYRAEDDPEEVVLPDSHDFLMSRARLDLEVALGGHRSTHYRHQVLAPVNLGCAIGYGVSAAMSCWTASIEKPMRCNFNLTVEGDVTMELAHGEEVAVSLKLGQDEMTGHDLNSFQAAMLRCVAHGGSAQGGRSNVLH